MLEINISNMADLVVKDRRRWSAEKPMKTFLA